LLALTRHFAPYLAVLLLIVAVSEFAAAGKRWQSLRALVAPAADIAIANVTYTFSLPGSSRAEYVPIAKPVLLAFPFAAVSHIRCEYHLPDHMAAPKGNCL